MIYLDDSIVIENILRGKKDTAVNFYVKLKGWPKSSSSTTSNNVKHQAPTNRQ